MVKQQWKSFPLSIKLMILVSFAITSVYASLKVFRQDNPSQKLPAVPQEEVINQEDSTTETIEGPVANKPEPTIIKEANSLVQFLESHPQKLALIRCSNSEKGGNSNVADWPICGIIGNVPKFDERVALNSWWDSGDLLSIDFVDGDEIIHESQKWELILLKFDENDSDNTQSEIAQILTEWQKKNQWVRTIEQKELLPDSLTLKLFYQVFEEQISNSEELPWQQLEAYIDRRILEIRHGLELFASNGEVIELAPLGTGQSSYIPAHYSVPKSLSEYSATETAYLYPEPHCDGASRQALLVHEPHHQPDQEAAFFFLLSYLQEQYPVTFGNLIIFQEGQPNSLSLSDEIFNLSATGHNAGILEMLENSHIAWKSSFYAPLNGGLNEIEKTIKQFLVEKELTTEGVWDEAIEFYQFREKSGALDTRAAIEANLRSRTNQQGVTQEYIDRLENLEIYDAAFAENLVEENGLRGALAYELYVEGHTSSNSGNSVSVYGLDDAGIYYASCALSPGCMGPEIGSYSIEHEESWSAIQPFRDWVMARTVVKGMESLDQGAVPVVAASVGTHLPLVRKFLCEAGVSTVTLAPDIYYIEQLKYLSEIGELPDTSFNSMESWQPPSKWHGTTPLMSYLISPLTSPPSAGIGLARPTGPGISQMLDTWLTNPGLM